MKKLLFLVLAFALVAPLAAAEAPAATAPSAGSVPAPDVANLSREEFLAVIGNTMVGVPDPTPVQTPPCPTSVACRSPIGICALSVNCTTTVLGPCCVSSGGPILCCINGMTIKVKKCPCAGAGCPPAQVTWGCA
jgi:hypothetical protein